ncbi:MAG: fibrobacter succinogenes major paralogous domain-containing protein, partial [Bacteroidota bacterium]|nr:fibrobacter succinogenes major paralogous domain-containing protein [Bacteroidota bacterium]
MSRLTPLVMYMALLCACTDQEEFIPNSSGLIETRAGGFDVTTTPVTLITSLSGTVGGTVSNQGGGNGTTERGVVYNTSPIPTIDDTKIENGSGSGSFECVLTAVNPSTTYYIRAYAIKKNTIVYGNEVTFTTLPDMGTVTDIEGHVYKTVNIAGKIWMIENLATTRYSDNTPIPNVSDPTAWNGLRSTTTGAFCNYNNDEANAAAFGRLYNWYAVSSTHHLAPAGWHIPSKAEWDALEAFLGTGAGGKLKEAGLVHWASPNTGGNNCSAMSVLPAGVRGPDGLFSDLSTASCLWSSSLLVGWTYYRYVRYNTNLLDWNIA